MYRPHVLVLQLPRDQSLPWQSWIRVHPSQPGTFCWPPALKKNPKLYDAKTIFLPSNICWLRLGRSALLRAPGISWTVGVWASFREPFLCLCVSSRESLCSMTFTSTEEVFFQPSSAIILLNEHEILLPNIQPLIHWSSWSANVR